ncbi:MAG: AraC family ligand binding domain-containing protein, partial [Roseburia sp.]|nr:AraC family ligand binding domain-containing protein [Roseburia sp.]
MCDNQDNRQSIFETDFNPTLLYTWKGIRTQNESSYHSHDHIEMAFVLSGKCRYRIDGNVYEVGEKDLIILNSGVKHQALVVEGTQVPSTEFYVAFSDIRIAGYPENTLPLPEGRCILHTTGDLYQKLFKISASMEAENTARKPGHNYMMKSYLVQMILLIIREQYEPVKTGHGYTFKTANKKYVVEQILNYFEDHYNEKISLDQIAENMYLSPFYISKIFKSETGDTPINRL